MEKTMHEILLIEDNPADVILLEESLKSKASQVSFKITVAELLSQGLNFLKQQRFDIVLLDLGLPDSQGLESFQKIHVQNPDQLVLVLSGLQNEEIAIAAVQSGAQDYLVKGQIGNDILIRAIRYSLERHQLQIALRKSEQYYRALLEHSADAITTFAADGTILYESPAAAQILKYQLEELIGRNIFDLVYPDDRALANELLQQLLKQPGVPLSSKIRCQRKDNTWVWVDVTGTNWLTEPAVQAIVINYRDITERQQAEAEIDHHLSELEVLYESGLSLSQLLNPQEIGQRLIEILAKKLDWHHAAIRLYHPETEQIELLAFGYTHLNTTETQEQIAHLTQMVKNIDQGFSGWVIKHGKAIRKRDLQSDPRYIETYTGMHSGLYVPLRLGQTTIGAISVESDKEDAFSEQDERLLLTLASQAAIAIKNAQLFLSVTQELHERVLAENKLRESERFAHATIDALPEHICVLDGNGVIIATNRAWRKFSENNPPIPQNFCEGDNYLTVCEKAEEHTFANGIRAVMRGETEYFTLEYSCDAPWEQRWFLATVIRFPGDGQLRLVVSHENVTARKQAIVALQNAHDELEQRVIERTADLQHINAELDHANTELKSANRLKDEFLSSMSHELRTPLTGILGLSESLQMNTYGDLSEKQLKALRYIEESGRHLLDLINDILDLSKIEAGRLTIQIEACSLNEICQASLQLTKGMAHQRQQQIGFTINPSTITLQADARRLKQMIVNLLSNAIKFTPEAGQLGLEVEGDETAHLVKLTVWDKGIGIKSENLEKLFKPFIQLDSSLARQYSGTGLGLSLVQRMTEMHGGSVKVESIFGEGSRFTILLPWANTQESISSDKRFGTTPLRLKVSSEASALILIADDNKMVLETLRDFLQSQQYRVMTVSSGQELLSCTNDLQPDLLLVDIQMPEMDGLETIRRLRANANKQVATTPIIAITALAMSGDRERCLAAGADDYLSKPVRLPLLLQTIDNLLKQTRKDND